MICSLAFSSVRNAWTNIASRVGPDATADEKKMWLERFSKQHDDLCAQIYQLSDHIAKEQQEVEIMQLQQQYTQQSALIQIQGGMSSMIWGGSNVGVGLGNARFAEAGTMQTNISAKRVRLGQSQEQLKALVF